MEGKRFIELIRYINSIERVRQSCLRIVIMLVIIPIVGNFSLRIDFAIVSWNLISPEADLPLNRSCVTSTFWKL